ncbi:hypothetical protein D3C87_1889790 [compost metagenome]
MLFQLPPPFVEDSHLTKLPVCPDKVNVPLLAPVQTAALVLTVPPTETGSMVIVAEAELASAQTPLLTTALYKVLAVKFV